MKLYHLIQRSYFGRLVYNLSNYKYFSYPEEQPDYMIPSEFLEKEVIIDWHESDEEHPKNWPSYLKYIIQAEITFLTFAIYSAAPVYTSAAEEIKKEFGISDVVSTLPLALYIFGYGLGPMIFSPLSEQPYIGRTPIYIFTGIIYIILAIPTALSKNIATLCVLRFFGGVFGSPALSVGPGTYTDVVHHAYNPMILSVWALLAFCSPSLSPIIGSGLVIHGWRTIFWWILAMNCFSTIMLFFFLPETYDKTLLLWRAQRLRRITGNDNILAESEVNKIPFYEEFGDILIRAFEIVAKEPMVLVMNFYQGLFYGLIFLWFESFPIVYVETYKFSKAASSAAFTSIVIGCVFGSIIYCGTLYYSFTKPLLNNQHVVPEVYLKTCLIGATCLTISMFLFGWSSTTEVHWIVSLIAAAIFGCGAFMGTQSILNYLAMCFPRYIPSVFAGSSLFRSGIGGSFPIFGRIMFKNLSIDKFPVAWGCTILGIICLGMNFLPILFNQLGPKLRARSKFSD